MIGAPNLTLLRRAVGLEGGGAFVAAGFGHADRLLVLLLLEPESLHQRVPVVMGSESEVERVISYHQEG